jgi:NAD(P)H-dependent FMN reductase
MADTPIRIAMISGSLRKGSFNTKLLKQVGDIMGQSEGVELDHISLSELDLPMFSEDLEAEAFPESALELKRRLIAADGVLVSSPEYNGSFSGALKNAIDWASRPRPDEEQLACFKGKVCALLAASPGAIGGLRGIRHVRQVLTQLQMHVIPQEFALGKAHEAFDDNDQLKEEFPQKMAKNVGESLVRLTRMHKSAE